MSIPLRRIDRVVNPEPPHKSYQLEERCTIDVIALAAVQDDDSEGFSTV